MALTVEQLIQGKKYDVKMRLHRTYWRGGKTYGRYGGTQTKRLIFVGSEGDTVSFDGLRGAGWLLLLEPMGGHREPWSGALFVSAEEAK